MLEISSLRYLFLLTCLKGFCYSEKELTPRSALDRLLQGNSRYVRDALEHPNRTQERREASLAVQEPFAVVVSCSDSRVAPEIIFDEGVGDLFVVRVAGNVIGPLELESIEYAALSLHSVIILVMGHENCGAVNAVVEEKTKDIEHIAKLIHPSIVLAKKMDPEHLLMTAIQTNALHMKELVSRSPLIQKLIKAKKISVEAAYYDLQTGAVEILSSEIPRPQMRLKN